MCQVITIYFTNLLLLGPIFSVFAVNAAPIAIGGSNFKVWELTFILSLLVATAVGFTSRSSPPVYHKIFAFIGFVISIVWIYMIANELVSVLRAFGVMFGLSDAILGIMFGKCFQPIRALDEGKLTNHRS